MCRKYLAALVTFVCLVRTLMVIRSPYRSEDLAIRLDREISLLGPSVKQLWIGPEL